MYAIRINDQFLDLLPGAALKYNLNNPLFDPETIDRRFNFPLTIPLTPRNRSTLGFPDRLDSARESYSYTGARLYLMHLPFDVGVATVTDIDWELNRTSTAQLELKNIESTFLEDLEKVQLRTLLDTLPCRIGSTESTWIFQVDSPSPGTYSMTIGGQLFEKVFISGGSSTTDIAVQLRFEINQVYPDLAQLGGALSDQLHFDSSDLNEAEVGITAWEGLSLVQQGDGAVAIFDAFYAYIDFVYNNSSAVPELCFPVMQWYNFYAGQNGDYKQLVNPFFSGDPVFENVKQATADKDKWNSTFVPFVRLPYIFEKLTEAVALDGIAGSAWESDDVQDSVLFNNRSIDEVGKFSETGTNRYLNHFAAEVDLNQHVPDWTGRQLLDAFIELLQLYPAIEDNVLHFFSKKDQLDAEPLDWTDKVQLEKEETLEKEGFTLTYARDPNDTAGLTENDELLDLVSGAGKNEYRTTFWTVHVNDELNLVDPPITGIKLPFVEQPGISPSLDTDANEATPRLFFCRGIQQTTGGDGYILGSHDHLDASGGTVGDGSLDWNTQEFGLYAQRWAGLPGLDEGNTVTVKVALDINDLLKLRNWQCPRVRFYTRNGEATGIVKQVKLNVTQEGLGLSTVTIVKQQ